MPTHASMKVATTRGRNTSGEVLSRQALNRATLSRQGLLSRWTMSVPEAIRAAHWAAVPTARPTLHRVMDAPRGLSLRDADPGTLRAAGGSLDPDALHPPPGHGPRSPVAASRPATRPLPGPVGILRSLHGRHGSR